MKNKNIYDINTTERFPSRRLIIKLVINNVKNSIKNKIKNKKGEKNES